MQRVAARLADVEQRQLEQLRRVGLTRGDALRRGGRAAVRDDDPRRPRGRGPPARPRARPRGRALRPRGRGRARRARRARSPTARCSGSRRGSRRCSTASTGSATRRSTRSRARPGDRGEPRATGSTRSPPRPRPSASASSAGSTTSAPRRRARGPRLNLTFLNFSGPTFAEAGFVYEEANRRRAHGTDRGIPTDRAREGRVVAAARARRGRLPAAAGREDRALGGRSASRRRARPSPAARTRPPPRSCSRGSSDRAFRVGRGRRAPGTR